jgi:5-formyltetrahydrofolate cyclo-ligase
VKAGELREQIWSELVRQNACAYPMPPHGHNPNFKGARAAAKRVLEHDLLQSQSSRVVLVGMEAALLPLRQLLLEAGQTVVVPHRTKAGAYWRLENAPKSAARIENFHVFGSSTDLEAVQVAVLASVAVDSQGQRLSKGFGFGARGAPTNVPTLTLAHALMVRSSLEVEADSKVAAFATPTRLISCI